MTLKQLEYFLAIAKHGHISAAARELNISQPPLSTQLRLLEEELGTPLFRRDKHNLIITSAGMLLRDKAMQILELTRNVSEELQGLGDLLRGSLYIGAITSVCYKILPMRAAQFLQANPKVDFHIWVGSSIRIMELLSDGTIEMGIVREPFNHDRYQTHPLQDDTLGEAREDPFVAVGVPSRMNALGNNRELALKDLEGVPLILHRRFNDLFLSACRKEGFQPQILCQNDDLVSSLSWAAAGMGVAIVPATSAALRFGDEPTVAKPIRTLALDAKLALITRKDDRLSPAVKAFIALMSSSTGQAPTMKGKGRRGSFK
ncbi:MAG: transcriptional regulator, LysR family protein [Paenibacillaceae bacterium]|jgi:DNA-binding transcriptional LysR family regulator|nr:transcriptional regulator, LysR family protein [Paenibacillaceae bacterium]